MANEDRKFVKVYFNDLIRDYPEVWADDATLATWLRMLSTADPMWPTPPELPRSVKDEPLQKLVDSSLVETLPSERFRMKGLDAERTRRQDAARNAAAVRWQSTGNAGAMQPHSERMTKASSKHERGVLDPDAGALPLHSESNAEAMPTRPDQNRPEQSRTRRAPDLDERFDAPEIDALAWLSKHGCDIRPGNGYHQALVVMVEAHGINAVVGMFDRLAGAGTKRGDLKGFVFGAKDALDQRTRPDLKAMEREDQSDDSEARAQRAVARTKEKLHFQHLEPSPGCPLCEAGIDVPPLVGTK